jgi:hopanoid biosynthesis associated protein HpnK
MQKHLIVTADDFGLHEHVNQAVESAARSGALTAASLMVAGPAAADAARRAAQLPNLNVGLHLVLADGHPTLDSRQIPALVGLDGRMGDNMGRDGLRFFLLPRVRQQLEAEIRAQFAAFARTGLRLDHVNAHKHFHLHPTILEILLRVGRDYGSPPVRATIEPLWFSFRSGAVAGAAAMLLRPWASLLSRKLRQAGVLHNDSLFGIAASGAMDEETLLHNTTDSTITSSMRSYRHRDELVALLSTRVRDAILASGATQGGFRDIRK